jgi:hypothetical protein
MPVDGGSRTPYISGQSMKVRDKRRAPKRKLTLQEREEARDLAKIRAMSPADKKLIPAHVVMERLGYHDLAAKLRD